jgi:hypothetical protein
MRGHRKGKPWSQGLILSCQRYPSFATRQTDIWEANGYLGGKRIFGRIGSCTHLHNIPSKVLLYPLKVCYLYLKENARRNTLVEILADEGRKTKEHNWFSNGLMKQGEDIRLKVSFDPWKSLSHYPGHKGNVYWFIGRDCWPSRGRVRPGNSSDT